jgi:hypothetical protein
VLNAVIAAKTDRTLTIKTVMKTLTVERAETESLQDSSLSIMPEGLIESLPLEQARDLIAYLMHKSQVSLPASRETTETNLKPRVAFLPTTAPRIK